MAVLHFEYCYHQVAVQAVTKWVDTLSTEIIREV
jgi:hypothetical protein